VAATAHHFEELEFGGPINTGPSYTLTR